MRPSYLPLAPIILITFWGCNQSIKQADNKDSNDIDSNIVIHSITKEDSLDAARTDSCLALLERLEALDTIVLDDTILIKKYYSSKIVQSKVDFEFTNNILYFKTGNPLFNKKLDLTTALLTKKYLDHWKKELLACFEYRSKDEIRETREDVRKTWKFGITITPLFLRNNMASFEVNIWDYAGGMHGTWGVFYKNYIFQHNQIKEISSEDFVDSEMNLDTIYFNRLKKTIEYSSQVHDSCDIGEQRFLIKNFIGGSEDIYDLTYKNVNFIFHDRGVRIKYANDYYTAMHGGLNQNRFLDKIIPRKEFNKVISTSLAKIWTE